MISSHRIAVAGVCALGIFAGAAAPADPPARPRIARPGEAKTENVPAGNVKPGTPATGSADVEAGLAEGFKIGTKNMPAAQAKFEAARRAIPGDPRVDYAEGLAWGKQVQWSKAQDQFERGAKRPGKPYWPTWQAWVWTAFRDKQADAGFLRILEMAKQLASVAKLADQPGTAEIDMAKWIGKLMSAASRAESSSKATESWSRTAAQLEADLGPALFKAYEAGRLEFFNEQQELLKKSQVKADERAGKEKQVLQVEQAKIDGNLARAAKEKIDAKLSAAEWKKWLDTETGKVDKDLAKLEKDYRFNLQQTESLSKSINLVGQEITVLSVNEPVRGSFNRAAWENQVLNRQLQLGRYQNEMTASSVAASELARQGNTLVAQRQEMVRQYEQATGVLLEKTADLQKWSTRLKDSKSKLQTKAAKPATGKVQVTFSTYLPFDLDVERDRVLRDLGIPAKSP